MVNTPTAFITWDDSWCTGITTIDEEHRRLVKLIQKLFGALISVQAAEHIREILHELIDYTRYHFNNEEQIMSEYAYPELADHRVQHQDLIRQVLDVSDRILTEGESEQLSDDVFEFLKGWLVNHIINEDLKFKSYLEKK
ncbi:MAG TPA: bacteriohemerythrin [Candidatus Marinimicrobia bacterium]|nr:bacteriohemerythrin [Candidatus Neomarinimicrobiota bacterium]